MSLPLASHSQISKNHSLKEKWGKSPFWGIFRIVSFSGTLHWSLLLFVFKQSLVPLDTSQYHMSIKLLSLGSLLTRPSFVRLSQKCYSWKSWEKGKNFFNFVLKTNYDMLFEILIFTFDLGSKFFAILKLANDHIGLKRRYILNILPFGPSKLV